MDRDFQHRVISFIAFLHDHLSNLIEKMSTGVGSTPLESHGGEVNPPLDTLLSQRLEQHDRSPGRLVADQVTPNLDGSSLSASQDLGKEGFGVGFEADRDFHAMSPVIAFLHSYVIGLNEKDVNQGAFAQQLVSAWGSPISPTRTHPGHSSLTLPRLRWAQPGFKN